MAGMHPQSIKTRLCDFLAAQAPQKFMVIQLESALHVMPGCINDALSKMRQAKWVTSTFAAGSRQLREHGMTLEQAAQWTKERPHIVGDGGGPGGRPRSEPGTRRVVAQSGAQSGAPGEAPAGGSAGALLMGIYSDGSLAVEGLGRFAVKVAAADVRATVMQLTRLPEGAMQMLLDSPLRPECTLTDVQGRRHRLSSEQSRQLVDFLESLPSKLVATPTDGERASPWAALTPRPGTDHRSHRLADDDDQQPGA